MRALYLTGAVLLTLVWLLARSVAPAGGLTRSYYYPLPRDANPYGAKKRSRLGRCWSSLPMGVFPLLKSLLPVVVAFLLPTTDTLDHRRVGNGTHRHGLFQEPMEELPAMA